MCDKTFEVMVQVHQKVGFLAKLEERERRGREVSLWHIPHS